MITGKRGMYHGHGCCIENGLQQPDAACSPCISSVLIGLSLSVPAACCICSVSGDVGALLLKAWHGWFEQRMVHSED